MTEKISVVKSRKTSPLLSLMMTVYNEEKNLKRVYEKCRDILKKAKISYEIIFIEGGSNDNSWKILQDLAKKNKDCKVLQAEMEPGRKANAAIKIANGKYFAFMCSDGQDSPTVLPRCIRLLEEDKADFVKGKRNSRNNWQRKIISLIYNNLVKILFGMKINDINGHPKVFRSALLKGKKLLCINESVDLEIVLRAHSKGYRIVEVPVIEINRKGGKSSVNSLVVLKFLLDTISFKWGSKKSALSQNS